MPGTVLARHKKTSVIILCIPVEFFTGGLVLHPSLMDHTLSHLLLPDHFALQGGFSVFHAHFAVLQCLAMPDHRL
jgi:hypothetical protein